MPTRDWRSPWSESLRSSLDPLSGLSLYFFLPSLVPSSRPPRKSRMSPFLPVASDGVERGSRRATMDVERDESRHRMPHDGYSTGRDLERDVVAGVRGVAAGGRQLRDRHGELAVAARDRLRVQVAAAPGAVEPDLVLAVFQT